MLFRYRYVVGEYYVDVVAVVDVLEVGSGGHHLAPDAVGLAVFHQNARRHIVLA